MARRRPEFEPGPAGAEAAKLKKFSDAGGTQIQWLSDDARTNFSITSGILSQRAKSIGTPRTLTGFTSFWQESQARRAGGN